MLKALFLPLLFGLSQCGDESLRAYGGADQVWTLVEVDGNEFPAKANLTFPAAGKLAGAAPCNSYSAEQTAPYPWFEAGPIATTKSSCPDQAAEMAYLEALSAMTQSEISGNTLILRNDAGREMVFRSRG